MSNDNRDLEHLREIRAQLERIHDHLASGKGESVALERSLVARLDRTDDERREDMRRLREEFRAELSHLSRTANATHDLVLLLARLHIDGSNGEASDALRSLIETDHDRRSVAG